MRKIRVRVRVGVVRVVNPVLKWTNNKNEKRQKIFQKNLKFDIIFLCPF